MLLIQVQSIASKNNLDRFWSNQQVYYNFRCDITGTGNRSVSQKELISNCIEVCYKEVDIEASKPASSTPIRYDIDINMGHLFSVNIVYFGTFFASMKIV